jgi:hypothetical protein
MACGSGGKEDQAILSQSLCQARQGRPRSHQQADARPITNSRTLILILILGRLRSTVPPQPSAEPGTQDATKRKENEEPSPSLNHSGACAV